LIVAISNQANKLSVLPGWFDSKNSAISATCHFIEFTYMGGSFSGIIPENGGYRTRGNKKVAADKVN
jgi:hypothetical protein